VEQELAVVMVRISILASRCRSLNVKTVAVVVMMVLLVVVAVVRCRCGFNVDGAASVKVHSWWPTVLHWWLVKHGVMGAA